MFHIGVSTKHPPLPEPGQLSEIGIDFIELCLTLEAARRPTAAELLRHPWLMPMQEQLTEHNSGTQSSFGSSFQSSNMTSMRSHGFTPETGMTPDTEMTGFTTGLEKPSRTNSEEAAHIQKLETAQGSAIESAEVSRVVFCSMLLTLTGEIAMHTVSSAERSAPTRATVRRGSRAAVCRRPGAAGRRSVISQSGACRPGDGDGKGRAGRRARRVFAVRSDHHR